MPGRSVSDTMPGRETKQDKRKGGLLLKTIGKINDVIVKGLKYICILLTVAFTLVTFWAVIARYVFVKPLSWSEQLCRYLFIWSVMLYMPVIQRERGNLGFDLVLNRLPKKFQQIFGIVCLALIAYFAFYYFDYTLSFVQKTMNKKLTGGIIVPYWAVYGAQLVGSGLLFIFTLELMINDIIALIKGDTTRPALVEAEKEDEQ